MISFLAFAISSRIQKGKLADSVDSVLDGGPFLLGGPQTILVLGTDVRSGAFAGPDEAESQNCLDAINSGKAQRPPLQARNYRSDTIMLSAPARGTLRKLSIPRDTLADIPGHGEEKINSAYAIGGAKLAVRTVEDLLGHQHRPGRDHRLRRLSQVHRLDRRDRRRPADRVCSSVSGGAFNLKLDKGENHLDGFQAITLARTRENTCGAGEFTGTDVERAQFQQLILDGIKGKLTSITAPADATSSRARSSAGTRRRRWSRAWACSPCPSS